MSKILWFTDGHVEPGQSNKRFTPLGNLIVEEKPDVIVQGGDFSSVSSLSKWDRDNRKRMEHRRYTKDMAAGSDAVDKLFTPLRREQVRQRRNKEKLYRPKVVWIDGNHEYWVDRYTDMNLEMDGVLNIQRDLEIPTELFSSYKYIPWLQEGMPSVHSEEGILFTHAPRNRGGVISSKYLAARSLCDAFEADAVFGHSHRFAVDSIRRVDKHGSYITHRAISGGCFFDEEPQYAKGNANDYWRGVILIDTSSKEWGFEAIPLAKLYKEYS